MKYILTISFSLFIFSANAEDNKEYIVTGSDITETKTFELENKSQFSEEEKELNMKFWKNYKILAKKYRYEHLHKNYESIFSPNFLKKNPQLLK